MRGSQIGKARVRLGLTREELGKILGCDKSTVSRWERHLETDIDPAFRRLLDVAIEIANGEELVVIGIGRMLQRELVGQGDLRALFRLLELHFDRKESKNAD